MNKETQIINKLIGEIVDEQKIGKIVENAIKSVDEKGDGYLSKKLTATVSTDLPKTLDLYVKCAPSGQLFRKTMPVKVAYKREIFFYDQVLPKLQEFQSKYKVENPFRSTLHCYKTNLEGECEMLILEDITKRGYFVSDRFKPMEPDQISVVLTEYAKFHAISFAMKEQEPKIYQEFMEEINKDNIFEMFTVAFGPDSYNILLDASTRMFDTAKDVEVLQRFRKFNETFVDFYFKSVKCVDEYSIITHADAWNNNMMFKENESKGLSVKLIDFQQMRVVSPICDISCFIFCCGSKQILDNINFYLNNYYQTLSDHIAAMGSDPNKVFSMETFQDQWKKYANFGLGMSAALLKLTTRKKEEVRDMEEDLLNNKVLSDDYRQDCASNKLYFERLRPVVDYCFENDLI